MTAASAVSALAGRGRGLGRQRDASIQALRSAAARDPKSAIRETAKQFEAIFMQQLMKSMREATVSSGMLDNSGTQLGTEMLDTQYASKMSGLPGGLADAIARQLERQLGAARAARRSAAARRRRRPVPQPRRIGAATPLSTRQIDFIRSHQDAARARRVGERHSGRVHAGAGGARVRLGPARDQERRRQLVAQPVRHQGRAGLERPGGRDHDHRIRRRRRPQKVSAKFRAYASDAESFRDYARMLTESPRYAGVAAQAAQAPASAASAQGFAQGLQRAGYATDPAYADKLARVINSTLRLQRKRLRLMSISSLLSIGASAMTANYAALQTTGNNVANANTRATRARAWSWRPRSASRPAPASSARASTWRP